MPKISPFLAYIVGKATSRLYGLRHVIHQLINDRSELNPGFKLHDENCEIEAPIHVSFRLCMANVLISACQKISDYGKEPLAKMILPCLIDSVEVVLSLNLFRYLVDSNFF